MTMLSAGRLLRLSAAAGAVGALTLVEPRALGPWRRGAYRVGVAVLSGVLVADTSRDDQALLDPIRDGIVGGGVTLGLMDVLERVDGTMVDGLRRVGITRPRPLLAALGAAGTAAMYLLPSLGDQAQRWGTIEELFEEPETVDLPGEARELIAALLAPTADGADLPGAATLRGQLAHARSVDPGYLTSDVQIEVEQPERLAVPRTQTWPVSGEFTRGGIRYLLQLQIDRGRLGLLAVMVADDEPRTESALEQLAAPGFVLPSPEELRLRVEADRP